MDTSRQICRISHILLLGLKIRRMRSLLHMGSASLRDTAADLKKLIICYYTDLWQLIDHDTVLIRRCMQIKKNEGYILWPVGIILKLCLRTNDEFKIHDNLAGRSCNI